MTTELQKEVINYQNIMRYLESQFPNEDLEDLRDTLEGCTDLVGMVSELLRSAILDELYAESLSKRILEMTLRRGRFDQRAKKKRQIALGAMEQVGIRKIEQEDFTAFVKKSPPKLVVVDEEAIDNGWFEITYILKKKALKEAIQAGENVQGAYLSNQPPTLTVRKS